MKGKFSKTEMRGLPGGPNEQFTYVTGVFMQDMYHVPKAQKGLEGKEDYDWSWQKPIFDNIEYGSTKVPANIKNNVVPIGNNTYEATPYSLPVAEVWGNPINARRQLTQTLNEGMSNLGKNVLESLSIPEALVAYGIDKYRGKDTELADVFPSIFSDMADRQHKGQPDVVTSATSEDWVKNNPGTAAILPLFFPGFGGKAKTAKKLADIDSDQALKMLNELQDIRLQADKDLVDIWDAGANESLDAISNKYNTLNQRWINNLKKESEQYANLIQNDSEIQNLILQQNNKQKRLGAKYTKKQRDADSNKIYERKRQLLIKEGYDPNITIEDAKRIEDEKMKAYWDLDKTNEDVIFDLETKKYVADPTGHLWNADKYFSTSDRALQESKDKFEDYFRNKNIEEQARFAEGLTDDTFQLKMLENFREQAMEDIPNFNWAEHGDIVKETAYKNYDEYIEKARKSFENAFKNKPDYSSVDKEVLEYIKNFKRKGGEGYRINAPNYNDSYKVIPSGNITMTEQDGGPLKKGPLLGIDNMGNQQMMFPGYNYVFPGDMVMEIPLRKAQLGEEPANTYMPYDKFRDSSDAYKYLAALNAAEKRRTELIKEAVVDEKGRKIIPIELQKRIAEDPILKWSTGAGGLKNVMPYEMFIDKFGEENLWKLEEEFLKNYSDDTKYYYENKLEDINNLFGDLSNPDYSVGRRGDILPSTNALYDTSKHSLYGTTLPIGEDYSEIEDKYNKELRVRKSLDESYQQNYGKSYDEVMKPIYASGKYPKSESQKLYWNPETNTPEWHYPSENPEKLKYWEELKEKERDEFSRFIKEYRNNNGINTDVYQTLPYKPGEDNFNNSLQNLPSQDDNTTTKEKPQLYSSPRQLNISTNIRSQPRDIGIQIGKPKINKDPDPGTRAWRDMMRAKTDEEKSLWQKAKQDGGGVKFNPYARAFPINEDIKAIVGDIGMRTNFKNKPAYINTSIKPTFGYIPEGPNIFDLKGEASVGMRSGDFNTELGVSKNFMRQDDPSLIGSIGYNTEKFGINASSNIPTKKNPNFFPSVNIRYNPNENLSIFGEGQYDSISKSPSFRTGLNYTFQQGGSYNFNELVKKYTTQGWDSLTPQEQQFYRETYQKGGSIKLDPAKKGTFKALATRYGMSMDKLAMDMKKNPDKYSPEARKKANFYRNFAMQSGGQFNVGDEVDYETMIELKKLGYEFE